MFVPKNPTLTQFARTSNRINQEKIDQAPKPIQFIDAWKTWLDESSFTLASWGGAFDHRLLSLVWKEVLGTEPSR